MIVLKFSLNIPFEYSRVSSPSESNMESSTGAR